MAKTQTERAVVDLVINGQQAKTTLKEVSLEVTRARSELNKMREADNPKLYAEKLAAMHKLVAAQRDMTARINDTSTAWGRFKKEMATVATGVVGGNVMTFLLQSLVQLIPSTIDRTMKLKDAFADLEKATGLSSEGVKKLNKEIKQIDTRTTNQELRDIAVAGGQLGVANDQLLDFVENVDKAVVALGDEFTGGVDQVAKTLGGIGKLFEETRGNTAGDNIKAIGSAINELGAAGSATGPVVAEFTTRMGQLGALAPKLAETMGLGAALQELGLTAEIAASGLSGLMLTAANKSELFAQHLKMPKAALEQLINTSPNEFLMKLAKSFADLTPVQVAQRLKELKVESQESIKVMSLLADQTGFVTEKQQLAAKAIAEKTSLDSEFSKKNHQLARDLKNLNEWFNSLLSSEGLQEFLVSAIHNTVRFTKALPQLTQWLTKNGEWFLLVGVPTLAAYNAALIRATAASVANTVAEGYRRVAYELGFRWLILQTTATQAYAFVTGVLTGQITLQSAAVTIARTVWTAFTAVLLANPIGLVAGALAALAGGLKYFSENTKAALDVERKKQDLQRVGLKWHDLASKAQKDINEKLAHYNDLSKVEQDDLKKTIALKQQEARVRLQAALARSREIARAEGTQLNAWERTKVRVANTFSSTEELKADMARQAEAKKAAAYAEAKQRANVDQLKADLDEFDKLMKQTAPQAVKPAGGGTLNQITDPEEAKRAAKKKQTDAQQDADKLEKMLADSRERIMTGERTEYDKEVAAFAEKYSQMYELAGKNEKKIQEIQTLSLVEWGEIEKHLRDKRNDEDLKRLRNVQELAEKELKVKRELALRDIQESVGVGGLTKEEGKLAEIDVEQQHLIAKEQLYTEHYEAMMNAAWGNKEAMTQIAQDLATGMAAIDQSWFDKEGEQATARRELRQAELEHNHELFDKKKQWAADEVAFRKQMSADMFAVLSNDWTASLEGFKEYWAQASVIQKAALVAQKAWAVAEIAINLARQISLITTASAVMNTVLPGSGLAFAIKGIATAVGKAALLTANVMAVRGFADGGFTGMEQVHPGRKGPSGFVEFPTLFNLGKRSYVAGEAGREFVVSNRALQNPIVADFTRMLDVAQKTGNYSLLAQATSQAGSASNNSLPAPGQPPGPGGDSMMVVAAIARLEQRIDDLGKRPIVNNYRLSEEYADRVQQIKQENTL